MEKKVKVIGGVDEIVFGTQYRNQFRVYDRKKTMPCIPTMCVGLVVKKWLKRKKLWVSEKVEKKKKLIQLGDIEVGGEREEECFQINPLPHQ